MMGDQTLPIENAAGASLLQLQCAAEDVSWSRTTPEDNILSLLFWIKESNYCTHSTFRGRLYFLGMFADSQRAQNWQVRCVAIGGHTRGIAQHICANLHLIVTVVLISRPIGPEKNSPRMCHPFNSRRLRLNIYIYIYIICNIGSKLDRFLRKRCFLFCFVNVVITAYTIRDNAKTFTSVILSYKNLIFRKKIYVFNVVDVRSNSITC